MKHEDAIQLLLAYLDKELFDEENKAVSEHIKVCSICQAELIKIKGNSILFSSLFAPFKYPVERGEKIMQKIQKEQIVSRGHSFFMGYLKVAAILFILCAISYLYINLLFRQGQQELTVGVNPYIHSQGEICLSTFFVNPENNEPFAGSDIRVEINQFGKNYNLGTFKTDIQGIVSRTDIAVPSLTSGQGSLTVRALGPYGEKTFTQPIIIKPPKQSKDEVNEKYTSVVVSTDKPVYKPGQIIHIRSLALNAEGRPVQGESMVYVITDPKGNKVFRQEFATSSFGLSWCDFSLGDEITLGIYRIEVSGIGRIASTEIKVDRYVLPRFKIEVSSPDFVKPGENIKVDVKATYTFGEPVGMGMAEIKGLDRWEHLTYSGRLDSKGMYAFHLNIPWGIQGNILFNVRVTDQAGHEENIQKSIRVITDSIVIDVSPYGGILIPGRINKFVVVTSYPDGIPALCSIKIGEREFKTDFLGTALLEAQSSQILRIEAKDRWGAGSSISFNPLTSGKVVDTEESLLVYPEKYLYRGNEKIRIIVESKKENGTIILDIWRGSEVIITASGMIKNGKAILTLEPLQELYGVLSLEAYHLTPQGPGMKGESCFLVEKASGLNIKTRFERKIKKMSEEYKEHEGPYRPGEEMRIIYSVFDDEGKSSVAALSTSVVDESIDALVQPEPENMKKSEAFLLSIPYDKKYLKRLRVAVSSPGINIDIRERAASYLLSYHQPKEDVGRRFSCTGKDDDKAQATEVIGITAVSIIVFSIGLYIFILISRWIIYYSYGKVVITLSVTACVFCVLLVLPVLERYIKEQFKASSSSIMRDEEPDAEKYYKLKDLRGGNPDDKGDRLDRVKGGEIKADARLRTYFPETLAWIPQLITDERGIASQDLSLADSITTWRVRVDGVNSDGTIGQGNFPLTVFQEFFVDLDLPPVLTQNDSFTVKALLYNYLDHKQNVKISLASEDWYKLQGTNEREIILASREVTSVPFGITVQKAGYYTMTVKAIGPYMSDAVRREIEVLPDGIKLENVENGELESGLTRDVYFPAEAIEGSENLILKLYPGIVSQVMDGMEGMLRMPHGCFEQASSSTYPNVLILDYMQKNKKLTGNIKQKALTYINQGYQSLIGYEVPQGGFSLWGKPPASTSLTAYGLMEFADMSRVSYVDPEIIARTKTWLMRQQLEDGSFSENIYNRTGHIMSTAYITWVLAESGERGTPVIKAMEYLKNSLADVRDQYTNALIANALIAVSKEDSTGLDILEKLVAQRSQKNGTVFWDSEVRTIYYSYGTSATIETTALIVYGLLKAKIHMDIAQKGLDYLRSTRDCGGGWGSTQATILALRAILMSKTVPMVIEKPAHIEIILNGKKVRTIEMNKNNCEITHTLELKQYLKRADNNHLEVGVEGEVALVYQLIRQYYTPYNTKSSENESTFRLEQNYSRKNMKPGDAIEVNVTLEHNGNEKTSMLVLSLPYPSGFELGYEVFDDMKAKSRISRWDCGRDEILVYIDSMKPGQKEEFTYKIRPQVPLEIRVRGASIYEYYVPENKAQTQSVALKCE